MANEALKAHFCIFSFIELMVFFSLLYLNAKCIAGVWLLIPALSFHSVLFDNLINHPDLNVVSFLYYVNFSATGLVFVCVFPGCN